MAVLYFDINSSERNCRVVYNFLLMLKTVYLMKMIKYNQKDEGLAEFTPKAVLILTSAVPLRSERWSLGNS